MSGEAPSPDVLVTVGTDCHPFDRLVTWVDTWLDTREGAPVTCLVQYGSSRPPKTAEGVAFLGHDRLGELMARAGAVVTHGGPSTIAEGRRHGHLPIVLARAPDLGEHVDDHQQRFVRRLSGEGVVREVHEFCELSDALEEALAVAQDDDGLRHTQVVPDQAALRFGELVDSLLMRRGR